MPAPRQPITPVPRALRPAPGLARRPGARWRGFLRRLQANRALRGRRHGRRQDHCIRRIRLRRASSGVNRLAANGATVRIAVHHRAWVTWPTSPELAIETVQANILDAHAAAAATKGADVVFNLVGILTEAGLQTYTSIPIEGARNVALAAMVAGSARLIHVSALGASHDAPALSDRSKAAGEIVVSEISRNGIVIVGGRVGIRERLGTPRVACARKGHACTRLRPTKRLSLANLFDPANLTPLLPTQAIWPPLRSRRYGHAEARYRTFCWIATGRALHRRPPYGFRPPSYTRRPLP